MAAKFVRLTRVAAFGGLLLALAAGLGLALWPCAYQGIAATGGANPEQQVCASVVQANGVGVLGVLALPVLLAVVGLVAVRGRHRRGGLATATSSAVGADEVTTITRR